MDDVDLQIGPLAITIRGRQFPESADFWDGNWLNVSAAVMTPNAQVEVSGPFLRNEELRRFRDEVALLLDTAHGSAKLDSLEPNLKVEIKLDQLGHADVRVTLTPDHLNQSHLFRFELDQTYLQPMRSACDSILRRYPIISP